MMFWMSITAIGSMPAKGSSSRMNDGEMTSARAISARRRSPPESALALRVGEVRDRELVDQLLEPRRAALAR